jgi:hypothetical protein
VFVNKQATLEGSYFIHRDCYRELIATNGEIVTLLELLSAMRGMSAAGSPQFTLRWLTLWRDISPTEGRDRQFS